ncbi:hypothetical protein BJX61DRAFT_263813 [Aspergillus egyptiacus]|nr:hypothetical protein BJX61DRAFT_263813 [Aspergillus egyptiacus]
MRLLLLICIVRSVPESWIHILLRVGSTSLVLWCQRTRPSGGRATGATGRFALTDRRPISKGPQTALLGEEGMKEAWEHGKLHDALFLFNGKLPLQPTNKAHSLSSAGKEMPGNSCKTAAWVGLDLCLGRYWKLIREGKDGC